MSVTVGAADGSAIEDTGYAILHDRKGGAHSLLISDAQRFTGIESPELAAPGAPNYFA